MTSPFDIKEHCWIVTNYLLCKQLSYTIILAVQLSIIVVIQAHINVSRLHKKPMETSSVDNLKFYVVHRLPIYYQVNSLPVSNYPHQIAHI